MDVVLVEPSHPPVPSASDGSVFVVHAESDIVVPPLPRKIMKNSSVEKEEIFPTTESRFMLLVLS
jgi:hypothetical protein